MPTINGLKVTGPDGRLLGYQATCLSCGTQVRAGYHLPQIWNVENQCEHYVTISVNSKGFIFEFVNTAKVGDTSCVWSKDTEIDSTWLTSCGEAPYFTEGGPTENGMRYCCYCGKPIAVEAYRDPEPEDDLTAYKRHRALEEETSENL